MILSDTRILEEIEKGTIKIEPYHRECLGSNSYDVHLGKVSPPIANIYSMQKNTTRLNISRYPMKALYYIRIFFIWV